ncbi:hypothetical protein [Streptomyces chryseus]|uniref:hypothetical protein n=1 Tax=Streptomyces chryseus TaxID=68186 RepID=UPI00110FE3CD|nr:hypothetical protein [Streptomyces chryseus]GGX26737.1 hypothetical protein GCM10010353_47300 [Streptomyces chryseus]
MANARITERVVRTEGLTLELSLDEARALLSLTNHVKTTDEADGPAARIKDVWQSLRDAGMEPAPRHKGFDATGDVTFSRYRTYR